MSNYNFSPTLDGLNNVDSSNVNSNTIITDYLTVNINSSVPTEPNGTNNNTIASTQFVQNAISSTSSGFAKLTLDNTFTGYNVFAGGLEVQNYELYINPNTDLNLGGNLIVDVGIFTYTITPILFSYMNGLTSNIQTQLNNRALLNAFNQFIYAKGQSNSPNIQITDSTGSKSIVFNTNSNSNYLNSLTASGESVIACLGSAIDTQSLCLTTWSSTGCAIKINPSSIRVRCSSNWIDYNTTNLTLNGPVSTTSTLSVSGNSTFSAKIGGSLTNIQYGDLSTFPAGITGTDNLFLGKSIGYNITSGSQNVCCGIGSGNNLTTGTQNLILGSYNAGGLVQGSYNVMMAGGAGGRIGSTSGEQSNVLIGYNCCITHSGDSNICIGRGSLRGDAGATTYNASSNIIIGTSAFFNGQTCSNNVSVGNSSGNSNTTGSNNLFLGHSSGYSNTTNNYLSCIGPYSGYADSSILSSNRMIFGSSTANEDYYYAGRPSLYFRDTTTTNNLFTTSTGTTNLLTNASTINVGTSTSTINLNGNINGSFSGSNFSEIVSKNSSNVTTFRAEPLNTNISFTASKVQLAQNDTATGYVSCCTINITPGFKNQMVRYSFPTSLYNTKTGFNGTAYNSIAGYLYYKIYKNGNLWLNTTLVTNNHFPTTTYNYTITGGAGSIVSSCEQFYLQRKIEFNPDSNNGVSNDVYDIRFYTEKDAVGPGNNWLYINTAVYTSVDISVTKLTATNTYFKTVNCLVLPLNESLNGCVSLSNKINMFPSGYIGLFPAVYNLLSENGGWLLCDGSTYAISSYPELFDCIGYSFDNTLKGTTNFKVPSLTFATATIYYYIKI